MRIERVILAIKAGREILYDRYVAMKPDEPMIVHKEPAQNAAVPRPRAPEQPEAVVRDQTLVGAASWYGPGFHGRTTASGEVFDQDAMTAAHKSLPFGTKLLVCDETTGKTVVVTVNDRGPFIAGRILDLSANAAQKLGIMSRGVARVSIEILEMPKRR